MAEEKEIFNILKDANGNGEAPDLREEGQAEGDAKSHAILPVKDESGNLQYIPMKDGAVLITDESAGTLISNQSGGASAPVGSFTPVLGLSLTIGKKYSDLEMTVSSFKDCIWKIEYVDDDGGAGEAVTEVYPGYVRTGAGSYTFSQFFEHFSLDTTGGTGVQTLRLQVQQRAGTGSSFNGSLAVIEAP